jgi:hypothetical protein
MMRPRRDDRTFAARARVVRSRGVRALYLGCGRFQVEFWEMFLAEARV